jgi:hypothetical protein
MTANEFIKSMAAEGFTGEFRATNGEHTYRGSIDSNGVVKAIRVQTVSESKQKINEIFKQTNKN